MIMPNMTVKLTNEELKALGRVAYASGPNKDIPYTEYVHYEAAEKAVIGTDGVLLRFEKVDLGDTDFYIKADEIPAPKGKATESREVPVAWPDGLDFVRLARFTKRCKSEKWDGPIAMIGPDAITKLSKSLPYVRPGKNGTAQPAVFVFTGSNRDALHVYHNGVMIGVVGPCALADAAIKALAGKLSPDAVADVTEPALAPPPIPKLGDPVPATGYPAIAPPPLPVLPVAAAPVAPPPLPALPAAVSNLI